MAKRRNKLLERKLAGAQAKKGRGGIAVKIETETTPKIAKKKVNFTKLTRRLSQAIEKNIRESVLDVRVQGYAVHPSVIYKEIINPRSPFMWEGEGGRKLVSDNERKKVAREISTKFYRELKNAVRAKGGKNLTGKDIPMSFVSPKNITVGYDDSLKMIIYSSSGNSYNSFTTTFLKPIRERLTETYPVGSNLRLFLEPNKEWIEERIRIGGEAYAAGRAKGLSVSQSGKKKTAAIEGARGKYRNRTGRLDYEGLDAGHTFGAAATGAAFLLEDRHDLSDTFDPDNVQLIKGIPDDLQPEVIGNITKIFEIDTDLTFEKQFSKNVAEGRLTILVPEEAVTNRRSGSATSQPRKFLRVFAREFFDQLLDVESSPSYRAIIADMVISSFIGKKPKTGRTSKSASFTSSGKIDIQQVAAKGSRGSIKYNTPKGNAGKSSGYSNKDLRQLIAFLNKQLHDKIQKNMGKGRSKQVLNYRTGRFAKSAKIIDLYPSGEKNAITARVKYMRKPYGVFEPGATRLATPGRNPARIFGRSIRQLLQEARIANLRRVKVDLHG